MRVKCRYAPTLAALACLALALFGPGATSAVATETIEIPGLEEPVRVYTDEVGIPHVYAKTRLDATPEDSEALYQLAALRVMERDYDAALELLLPLVQKDRKYGDDAARKAMLAIFDILGGSGDLVSRYRTRMFNALH